MKALFLFVFATLSAPVLASEPETVPFVDVGRYGGTWYQISHIPLWFEGGNCACARQQLTADPNKANVIDVFNSCNTGDFRGKLNTIRGEATNEDLKSNAKFNVDFHTGIIGTYWIIGLDPEYRFAVVTDKNKMSLYILSKTPTLEDGLFKNAAALAAKQLDISQLVLTDQRDCRYPQ